MGLLLKLNNGDTQLKSLKFGKDRPGGGDSGQPYLPPNIQAGVQNPSFYNDFIVRGGIEAPLSAAEDVVRLTKYFINIKNPSGLLFTAKQNLLSRVGTKTEASKGLGYAGGALNEGAYTPLSTLAEAGIVWAGGHVNKQGLDPTGLFSAASINKYQDVISQNQLTGRINLENNRLVRLSTLIPTNNGENNFSFVKGYSLNPTLENDVLISYGGGPDSVLGIGKTKIKFATGNDGVPLKTLVPKPKDYLVGKPYDPTNEDNFQLPTNASSDYNEYIKNFSSNFAENDLTKNGKNSFTQNFIVDVYESGSLESNSNIGKGSWTQQNFVNQPRNTDSTTLEDFRKILNPTENPQYTFLSLSPNYTTNNIEKNLNLNNPGAKGNISSYTAGKKSISGPVTNLGPVDKVNASPIYKTNTKDGSRYPGFKNANPNPDLKDIIPFFIAILNNDSQVGGTYKKYMHFRAFIDSFSDSYNADWNAIEYMGRAEKFYKYGGFSREISMAFTIVAQSREEITAMYDKLNFLASSLAPEYLDSYTSGYMAGNISYITLGGYLDDQPGVITSLTYDVPEEAPWEIGIDDAGDDLDVRDIRQVPHMIKVTGIKFIPIHKFRPEKQSFRNDILGTDSTRLLNTGKQRYLDQLRPEITNYDAEAQNVYIENKKKILSPLPTISLKPLSQTNVLSLQPSGVPTNSTALTTVPTQEEATSNVLLSS
jgi:hypothetical protein